jgi:hypothetical protein
MLHLYNKDNMLLQKQLGYHNRTELVMANYGPGREKLPDFKTLSLAQLTAYTHGAEP